MWCSQSNRCYYFEFLLKIFQNPFISDISVDDGGGGVGVGALVVSIVVYALDGNLLQCTEQLLDPSSLEYQALVAQLTPKV